MMQRGLPATQNRAGLLLRIVLLLFGSQIGICYFVHWLYARELFSIRAFWEADDFFYFHGAARAWLAGHNPYAVFGFVTPPVSLIVPALLAGLSEPRAALLFSWISFALVALALARYAGALEVPARERLLLLLAAALFISAQESVRGGNMDGLIFALLVAAFTVRKRIVSSLWLAAGIAIKLYPIIFIAVALRKRQWRLAWLTVAWTLLLSLPFVHLWKSALEALAGRSDRALFCSISPATVIFALAGGPNRLGHHLSLAFWAITFGVALYRDRDGEVRPQTLARYIPWMLALPSLVWSYVGVLALATLAALVATAAERPLQRAERFAFVGFLLLGIHIERVTDLLPLTFDTLHPAARIQSAGVMLMIFASCLSSTGGEPSGRSRERLAEPCTSEA